ncbi:hypothetical protein KC19_N001300 [Ceratodon purpureus]|nr:hypothetical protein KC19_N001300 [Ceratodon purpureus]
MAFFWYVDVGYHQIHLPLVCGKAFGSEGNHQHATLICDGFAEIWP